MKRLRAFSVLCLAAISVAANAQTAPPSTATQSVNYGSNPSAAATFTHDGVTLYYETYGSGQPLLLIHGNGGSIADLAAQIDFFRKYYKVIAMDSRDHGKSSDSPGKLNYELMTRDLAALLDHLHTGPVYVLGWSDGGIEALQLGYLFPAKVKKIVSMAANLTPDGLAPEALKMIHESLASTSPASKNTPEGKRETKVTQMMLDEPHITFADLAKITAPTLILASDHDLISDQHTLDIYHHIPNSQLAIFPNATHAIPYDDAPLFNATVYRFLTTPYVPKDRVADALKSFEAMKSQPIAPTNKAAAEATLRKLDAQWGQAKTADEWLSFYSDNAIILPPNEKALHGREAARKAITELLSAPNLQLSWATDRIDISDSVDLAYIVGTYTESFTDASGKKVSDTGHLLEVWQLQPNNQWKCVADTWNSDLPLTQ
jgi:pimeloyl-ACP methyl ester carboxylesterase/ketosteroid isomerase-like protein